MEIETELQVEIEKDVMEKIEWLVNNYDNEISGWLVGEVKQDKIIIKNILFPYQEVGGASVDTNGQALVKLRKEYGDECKKIIGHFHSHNSMGAFWSSTDDEFITQFMEVREKGIFIVSSKEGHKLRLEIRKPIKLSIDDLDYKVIYEKDNKLEKELKKMIKEKVTEVTYDYQEESQSQIPSYNGYGYTKRNYGFQREVLDYTNKNEINKRIKQNLIYNPNTKQIVLRDVGLWEVDRIMGEFSDNNPQLIEYENNYRRIIFNIIDKKQGLKLLLELKEFLKELYDDLNINNDF